jgi:RNase P/RNase MRP subunit POP5
VDPRYFGVLNTQLVRERDRLVAHHISSVFYPVTVQVNTQKLSATIIGDVVSMVGKETVASRRIAYQVQYHYEQGRLLVSQFREVKAHD